MTFVLTHVRQLTKVAEHGSIDKAEAIGINRWRSDRFYSTEAKAISAGEYDEVKRRIGDLEQQMSLHGAPQREPEQKSAGNSLEVERTPGGSSLIDVLDRILDKGIVVDAWVRFSLVGIDLTTVEARIVIASIDTHLKYAEAVGIMPMVSRPALGPGEAGGASAIGTLAPGAAVRRP